MNFPIEKFQKHRTPFYYYDTELLDATLQEIRSHLQPNYHMHYAVKACATPTVLRHIQQAGLGCDCVSGGEIMACLDAGFDPSLIVFAGVGKSDWEIELGLQTDIFCFNCESIPELEVINELAAKHGKVARVAFRINPNVGAHTHVNITTGLAENKFGIAMADMEYVIRRSQKMKHVECVGLHFHIGSQILEMDDFVALCHRINELQDRLEAQGFAPLPNINVGGGLGIDYKNPDANPIPRFAPFFQVFRDHLQLRPGQHLHFELGRAVVGQCGSLIARVLYIKSASQQEFTAKDKRGRATKARQFCIIDAGMTDLIRPALYGAHHRIDNLTSHARKEFYDVVGPICESSDVFAKRYSLPRAQRGDLLAIRSAGAYGEIMASQYNCRPLPQGYATEDFETAE